MEKVEKAKVEKAVAKAAEWCMTYHSTPRCTHNTNRSSKTSLLLREVYSLVETAIAKWTPRAACC